MPAWVPLPEWPGGDAYVIGGGASLTGFRWQRLQGRNTIGCNSAFKLGAQICSLCFFSDEEFFNRYEDELAAYAGRVVTHCESISFAHPWVLRAPRRYAGLHKDGIGFGGNSGCSAINLALLLGARRVFLLGFDCQRNPSTGRTHWHDDPVGGSSGTPDLYQKFIEGFQDVARSLQQVFPGTKVYNCSPTSVLTCFPKANLDEFLPP